MLHRPLVLVAFILLLTANHGGAARAELLTVLSGESAGNNFGISVGAAGDVNQDGYGDVIVGANYAHGRGRAYVYFGGPSLHEEPDLVLEGEAYGDEFGWPVGGGLDINGDSVPDFASSAYRNDANGPETGRVYLYWAGAGVDAVPDLLITGEGSGDMLNWFALVPDFDGDGHADLAVGADRAANRYGRVYVFHGGPSVDNEADWIVVGEATMDGFGERLASAGDVNGDGYSDVLVGANKNATAGLNAGRAYIYYGGPEADSVPDVIMTGEAAEDYFGYSVGMAGDVNKDGYGDVLVGAATNDAGGVDAGRTYLFLGGPGADGVADLVLTGESAGDDFGRLVAAAGDVNKDGFDDFLVGAPGNDAGGSNAGRVYIYFGGESLHTSPDIVLSGDISGSSFGYAGEVAGDVNGDGVPEIAIGALGAGPGYVYIYRIGPKTYRVPQDLSSISEALEVVGSGDSILVASGTYYEHDLMMKAGIVLFGESGSDSTTIDAQQLGRVFHCVGVDSTAKIRGFTIRNGWAELGAGMLCESSSPEITDCVFSYNTGENPLGGGIALVGSSPRLTNCVFYENGAVSGGAIYCEDSHPSMSGCTVVANLALSGSAIYCKDGSVVSVENSIVAFGLGGEPVVCATGSSAVLTCSDVYGNEGGDWVGCIAGQQGVVGNFSADPLFCAAWHYMYTFYPESPCAPENNPTCGLVGALPAGCNFTGVAAGGEVPRAYSLSANWPNPFNPSTSIRFALPERAEVDVTLYDAAGRRVARLASGVYEAGEHVISWNGLDDSGRQVPSGTYFARLHAGEYGDVRKMVLIR